MKPNHHLGETSLNRWRIALDVLSTQTIVSIHCIVSTLPFQASLPLQWTQFKTLLIHIRRDNKSRIESIHLREWAVQPLLLPFTILIDCLIYLKVFIETRITSAFIQSLK